MITITRNTARSFRAAARKCVAGRPRGPAPVVVVERRGGTLTIHAAVDGVALKLEAPPQSGPDEAVAVPVGVLSAAEGGGDGPVELHAAAGRGEARWSDRGVPRSLAFDSPAPPKDHVPPPTPAEWSPPQPGLLAALHECGRSAAREGGRFALHRVQLRGSAGQAVGTDGKAALIATGLSYPFAGDLLVPAVPVFGAKELAGAGGAATVGRTEDQVVVKTGPWTVWLPIDGGRYPDVAGVLPRGLASLVGFDERDALVLLDALPGMPGGGTDDRPVTLDLAGTAAVRASGPRERSAELRLSRSPVAGPACRVALDRALLARALRLGCLSARAYGPAKPVVFEGGALTYVAMTLDGSAAAPPDPDAAVVSTDPLPAITTNPVTKPTATPPPRTTPVKPPETNGHAAGPPPPAAGTPDPLAEAEALRALFAEGAARAARLVALLRHRKREQKALTQAWSSLKSLHLGTE